VTWHARQQVTNSTTAALWIKVQLINIGVVQRHDANYYLVHGDQPRLERAQTRVVHRHGLLRIDERSARHFAERKSAIRNGTPDSSTDPGS
jgi:hypothetical protein